MKINIEKLIDTAKIKLSEAEKPVFTAKLEEIAAAISGMPDIDGAPCIPGTEQPIPLREDRVLPSLKRDDALKNAPKSEAGCFVVPKTL